MALQPVLDVDQRNDHVAQKADPPRKLADPTDLADPSLAKLRYQSPFRYPGAKSGLAKHIAQLVRASAEKLGPVELFVEPFAGGASTSLRLVGDGVVRRVLLADADPLVARFWRVAAADTQWLIDRMWDEPITLDRWDYWKAFKPKNPRDRSVAMKCLFLNRTTFSGILHGQAGPIGGRTQTGPYKIDCRFNKTALQERLEYIGALYDANRILDVWCKDWEATLGDVSEWYPHLLPDRVVAYLDPPYLTKSAKLYGMSFDPAGGYASTDVDLRGWKEGREHLRLAEHLRRRARYRWILSYDNSPVLATPGMYGIARMTPDDDEKTLLGIKQWRISRRLVTLQYTASGSGRTAPTTELLLTTLPPSTVPVNGVFRRVP